MPKSTWKSTLLGVLTLMFVVAGFAYLHSGLSEIADRLAQSEEKLRQVEKAQAKLPAPATAAQADRKDVASTMELDALRAELTEMKKLLALRAPTGDKAKLETAGAEGDTVKAGDIPADKIAAIKKVVEDTLDERDKKQRSQWTGMTDEWLKSRRKQVLDDLETRLKLTGYQKEQIGTILEEQTKAATELMAGLFGGGMGGGGGNREDSRKKIGELETTTETKVKQLLTAQQSTEYDTWKQETGGLRAGFGGGGGARIMRGFGGGGGGQGGGGPTGGGDQPK